MPVNPDVTELHLESVMSVTQVEEAGGGVDFVFAHHFSTTISRSEIILS